MPISTPIVNFPIRQISAPVVPNYDPIGVYQQAAQNAQNLQSGDIRNRLMDMYIREQTDKQNFLKLQAQYQQNMPAPAQFSVPQPPMMPPEMQPPVQGIGDRGPNSLLEQNTTPIEQPPLEYMVPPPMVDPNAAAQYPVQAMQYQQEQENAALQRATDIANIFSKFKDKDALLAAWPTMVKIAPQLKDINLDYLDIGPDEGMTYEIPGVGTFVKAPKSMGGNTQFIKDDTNMPGSSQAASIKGRALELIASGMDKAAAFKQAADEYDEKDFNRKMRIAREGAIVREAGKQEVATGNKNYFGNWTPDAKKNAFYTRILTNKDPKWLNRSPEDQKAYNAEYFQFLVDKGITPSMVARIQADVRAKDKSYSNQEKIYGPMRSFVNNMDIQIGRVHKALAQANEIDRVQPGFTSRLMNMVKRDLKMMAAGSGPEASLAMLLLEISNEAAKLSTNSSASIREISVEQAARWAKIHDPNLPVKDLIQVLNSTYRLGHDRIATTEEAKQFTLMGIEGMFDDDGNVNPVQQTKLPNPYEDKPIWERGPTTNIINTLPNPATMKGKRIRDTSTGKILKSTQDPKTKQWSWK